MLKFFLFTLLLSFSPTFTSSPTNCQFPIAAPSEIPILKNATDRPSLCYTCDLLLLSYAKLKPPLVASHQIALLGMRLIWNSRRRLSSKSAFSSRSTTTPALPSLVLLLMAKICPNKWESRSTTTSNRFLPMNSLPILSNSINLDFLFLFVLLFCKFQPGPHTFYWSLSLVCSQILKEHWAE